MTEEKNRKQPYSKEVPEEDRLKVAAIAMESNKKLHNENQTGKRGSKGTIEPKDLETLSKDWPTLSKEVLKTMVKFYGQPNEATSSQATWYYNGPWKRTTVHKDGYVHDFPEPHVDMLEQVIDYSVPKEKVGDIGMLEGSLVVDRTKGEVAVHCDNEGANTISLNMMHEVVTGEKTPEEARQFIVNELPKYLKGESAPYAETFQFDLPEKEQGEPDQREVFDKELSEKISKAKEKLNAE